jgi:prolyl-tRNA editing enzyme YbaK/EbsC (Cys-tRNA(Pro) deacylase)
LAAEEEERRRKASQERRAAEEEEERRSRVPPYPATVATMDAYVQRHFRNYTWPPIELTNGCAAAPVASLDFSPTQNFIRHYLTPTSPYHGLLAFHSVGTGKTCLAIATATTTFEPEGWTILYVTKTTLKGDVWKNMFDQVCSLVLQEKLRNGVSIPTDKAARMRMLSKSWSQIQPLSYRQFSNMLRGKSALAAKLRAINGKHDPLRKTLVVIDEAHKLFVSDMPPSEKCDIVAVKKAIDHSYTTSGTDAVKLLLMTGTPYTDDPMDMIKLLNLLFDPTAKLPETFGTFAQTYLNTDGHFTDSGHTTFSNQIAGYVSYLNREKDRRTFSYPIFYDMTVPMATLGHQDLQIAFDTHQQELNELEQTLKSLESGEAVQKMEAELKQCLQTLAQVQQCKTDATRHYDPLLTEAAKQCDRKAYRRLQQEHQAQLGQCLRLGADDCTPLKEALAATKANQKLTIQTTKQHVKDTQKKLRDLKTKLQKHTDSDLSQRAAIQECLAKKNKPEE